LSEDTACIFPEKRYSKHPVFALRSNVKKQFPR